MGNIISWEARREENREREKALVLELCANLERLMRPTELWTGLVTHHKDIFVSHVISKLNTTDRWFFANANSESQGVLLYAGVNVSELHYAINECSSISTLEFVWNHAPWGEIDGSGSVVDQASFCSGVALTNKLEFLKWAREVKQCEWNERTITVAVFKGNLEILEYCFSNDCPYDERTSCFQAAIKGHLDCLRFLFDKVKPSRDTEKAVAIQAAGYGHLDILKYLVEERKITHMAKIECLLNAAMYGRLDCLNYLVEEVKVLLRNWRYVAYARYHEQPHCVNYLLEKGCPEPTDEEYVRFVERQQQHEEDSD